jgi:hypothetical protein
LFALQPDNDGLWCFGDAPRHAMTGLFWKGFLRQLPADSKAFVLSYFTRDPAINPVSYPPLFHLIEAGGVAIFDPSPFVAKGIVLCFALIEALDGMAWLRRWVAKEAGFYGAFLLLLPGQISLSHAIMLKVPA